MLVTVSFGASVENKINRNDRSLKFTTTPERPQRFRFPFPFPSQKGNHRGHYFPFGFGRSVGQGVWGGGWGVWGVRTKYENRTKLYLSLSISFYVVRYGSERRRNFLLASDDGCRCSPTLCASICASGHCTRQYCTVLVPCSRQTPADGPDGLDGLEGHSVHNALRSSLSHSIFPEFPDTVSPRCGCPSCQKPIN